LLMLGANAGLFDALDRWFLSDNVVLQMPRALAKLGEWPAADLPLDPRWSGEACGRAPHMLAFMGSRAGVPSRVRAAVAAGAARHGLGWRCSVALRLLRTRESFMSSFVRARGELHCPRYVTATLWRLGQAVAAGPSSGTVAFVDVGASLGDCMLVAATLLPEGTLRGITFEADSLAVDAQKASMAINGLTSGKANASNVIVKHAALLNETGQFFTPELLNGKTEQLPSTTLDSELAYKHEHIDLLNVYVGGAFRMAVLKGTRLLLEAQRVSCILIQLTAEVRRVQLARYMASVGYRACDRSLGAWVPHVGGWCQLCLSR